MRNEGFKLIGGAFVVAFLLIGLGILLYANALKTNPSFSQIESTKLQILKDLEVEIMSVDLGDIHDGFSEIDEDLSKLK